jgi:NTE family protein
MGLDDTAPDTGTATPSQPTPAEAEELALAPVTHRPTSPAEEVAVAVSSRLDPGIALCLSGGGYRAMLFHLGTLWRLNDAGYLRKLTRVSSVSGGSITAAILALAWRDLRFSGGTPDVAENFTELVVAPICELTTKLIDIWAGLRGLVMPTWSNRYVVGRYRSLFGTHNLQDLPALNSGPEFVITASNLQSGVLWQFSRKYAGDYLVGWIDKPQIGVAEAVGASSAFPPFLSPAAFKFKRSEVHRSKLSDLNRPPFTTNVMLTDGGVYDNLGLETAWKYFKTVLVSDGGAKMQPVAKPGGNWFMQFLRIREMADNQVRGLRKRQLIASYTAPPNDENHRAGAYWGIGTEITGYKLPDPLPCPPEKTLLLAQVMTRLAPMDKLTQQRLINWGFAVCDAAMRTYVDTALKRPADFPYPDAKV